MDTDEKRHSRISSQANSPATQRHRSTARSKLRAAHILLMIVLLLLNYFIAQYDKFVLSYFQAEVIESLGLTSTQYGLLSGYATGIISALTAIPIAFLADWSGRRVWTLTAAALWWNACVICQGYSKNFWQLFLARLAMSIGQSPVEALSISVISDLVPVRWLFLAESILYVGVYIGEAVSAQIATAFLKTDTPWNVALRAIGIVGLVLIVMLRLVVREPPRTNLVAQLDEESDDEDRAERKSGWRALLVASVTQVVRMKSFWILTLSAGARQFSGNVFGWYMPAYLSSRYASKANLLSNYGIIVGVVGTVAVVLGGVVCSATPRRPAMALYITAIGGMISAVFVICMVFSREAGGSEDAGVRVVYGCMSAAYLTAELWLGAFASLLALLLPPRIKTVCLSLYTCTIILIYSS
ncbi:uncharacterized protein LTR77_007010 [Saxophila tyrrhenica]|uniref:Major facilitator superfamily (MFS) profile domain-containing protein n=1 Tax=Saxophila tyrrhenica TaxID=1690608 RepID=A0AAV9P6B5_9PEZI|nr:hypothetical protein LTR77_007010 [Saxophila tyrrhenica]